MSRILRSDPAAAGFKPPHSVVMRHFAVADKSTSTAPLPPSSGLAWQKANTSARCASQPPTLALRTGSWSRELRPLPCITRTQRKSAFTAGIEKYHQFAVVLPPECTRADRAAPRFSSSRAAISAKSGATRLGGKMPTHRPRQSPTQYDRKARPRLGIAHEREFAGVWAEDAVRAEGLYRKLSAATRLASPGGTRPTHRRRLHRRIHPGRGSQG